MKLIDFINETTATAEFEASKVYDKKDGQVIEKKDIRVELNGKKINFRDFISLLGKSDENAVAVYNAIKNRIVKEGISKNPSGDEIVKFIYDHFKEPGGRFDVMVKNGKPEVILPTGQKIKPTPNITYDEDEISKAKTNTKKEHPKEEKKEQIKPTPPNGVKFKSNKIDFEKHSKAQEFLKHQKEKERKIVLANNPKLHKIN